jgi:hypothetical protein
MMVDVMIRLKQVADRTSVTVHLRALDQHLDYDQYGLMVYGVQDINFGLSASNGSWNATRNESSCFAGIAASSISVVAAMLAGSMVKLL